MFCSCKCVCDCSYMCMHGTAGGAVWMYNQASRLITMCGSQWQHPHIQHSHLTDLLQRERKAVSLHPNILNLSITALGAKHTGWLHWNNSDTHPCKGMSSHPRSDSLVERCSRLALCLRLWRWCQWGQRSVCLFMFTDVCLYALSVCACVLVCVLIRAVAVAICLWWFSVIKVTWLLCGPRSHVIHGVNDYVYMHIKTDHTLIRQ